MLKEEGENKMKVLVLNCGSSSLKYQLIDMSNESVLAKGLCERIGIENSRLKHEPTGKDSVLFEENMESHAVAVKMVLDALTNADHGVLVSMDEIVAVGHRVVHGGEYFSTSVIIDDEVMKAIDKCSELAPLHNPANLIGIEACAKIMPTVKQIAVFDTAFHQTMPERAYLYAIPYEYYEKHKIRRYGFHGTSHKFVSEEAAKMLGKPMNECKIITCHLGNGGSICAIRNGVSIDTTMGFTPLEGLVMGTRAGDVDAAVVTFLMEKENLTAQEMDNILNKKSGVLGISGVSSDFRDVESASEHGNARAEAALDVFTYKVAQRIGGYAAAMNGVDCIVFTAGLGENSGSTRRLICDYLGYLGVHIDSYNNSLRGKALEISATDSKLKVYVIPTNEELVIARDTKELLDK